MKVIIALLAAAALRAQAPTELTVRLTAPLTTKMNRVGDMVVAKVTAPAEYAGRYLEGEVREIHPAAGAKRCEIFFLFQTLYDAGKKSPIAASVTRVSNSRQEASVDEDGAAVEQERGGRFSQLTAAVGSKLSKSSKPLSASELAKLSAKAKSISFAPGSVFTVQFNFAASK